MFVSGCEGKEVSYRVYTDGGAETIVVSTTQPKIEQAGWGDSNAEPPVPSWIIYYTGLGKAERFFDTIVGFDPQVEKLRSEP